MTLVLRAIALLCAVLAATVAANAQTYPSKPITIVVPFGPGSGSDTDRHAIVGQRIGTVLGQSVIIENKPGANGAIAAVQVARSAPDGYTIFLGTNTPHVGGAEPQQDHRLRSGEGFRGAVPDRQLHAIATGASRHSGKVHPGTDRPRQGQPRQAVVRQRQRLIGGGGETLKRTRASTCCTCPISSSPPAVQDVLGGRVSMLFTDMATGLPQPANRRAARPCHHAPATQRAGAGAADAR